MQSKMFVKICVGILGSSFYVKEFEVIVHNKSIFLYNPIKFLAILYNKSPANLVVEVGTRQSPDPIYEMPFPYCFVQLFKGL